MNDKIIIIPKEEKDSNIFSRIIRDVNMDSNEIFTTHLDGIHKYMELNNIPIIGKRFTDVGNVLLRGSAVIERSVIDYVYLPFSLDDRQHELLLSYIDEMKESNDKIFAIHAITKQDNKYKFNSFEVSANNYNSYDDAEALIYNRWFNYKVRMSIKQSHNDKEISVHNYK